MHADSISVKHARRALLAGWLLVAVGIFCIGYVVVGSMAAAGSDNPWAGVFLPMVIIIGVLIGIPPLLTGIGVLNHRPTARWIGILMAAAGVIGFGGWLVSVVTGHPGPGGVPWLGILVLAVTLMTSALVCWALATSGEYFGSRYWDLVFQATQNSTAGPRMAGPRMTWRAWRDDDRIPPA